MSFSAGYFSSWPCLGDFCKAISELIFIDLTTTPDLNLNASRKCVLAWLKTLLCYERRRACSGCRRLVTRLCYFCPVVPGVLLFGEWVVDFTSAHTLDHSSCLKIPVWGKGGLLWLSDFGPSLGCSQNPCSMAKRWQWSRHGAFVLRCAEWSQE